MSSNYQSDPYFDKADYFFLDEQSNLPNLNQQNRQVQSPKDEKQKTNQKKTLEFSDLQFEEEEEISVSIKQDNQIKHIRIIQVNEEKQDARNRALVGNCYDAKSISKHLHTFLINHLKELLRCKIFNENQKQLISQYKNHPASISSAIKLFECDNIRQKCLTFLTSPKILKKCISSNKMEFRTKISIIKYLQRLKEIASPKEIRQKAFKSLHWRPKQI